MTSYMAGSEDVAELSALRKKAFEDEEPKVLSAKV